MGGNCFQFLWAQNSFYCKNYLQRRGSISIIIIKGEDSFIVTNFLFFPMIVPIYIKSPISDPSVLKGRLERNRRYTDPSHVVQVRMHSN